VALSNHDTPRVRELYAGFEWREVKLPPIDQQPQRTPCKRDRRGRRDREDTGGSRRQEATCGPRSRVRGGRARPPSPIACGARRGAGSTRSARRPSLRKSRGGSTRRKRRARALAFARRPLPAPSRYAYRFLCEIDLERVASGAAALRPSLRVRAVVATAERLLATLADGAEVAAVAPRLVQPSRR
jgi:hypothetical protein